jgi:spore coat protein CotH
MKQIVQVSLIFSLYTTLSCGPAPTMIGEWPMFDPDWIVEVEIEIDEADWDELRIQRRDPLGALCNPDPPPNPFTYFPADITVDGHRVENVGVRKKCFYGSCSDVRPALKVSFNEYVRGRRFYGMRRLTLNNNLSDPSNVKQCLGYWLFRKAGVVAPRCNFAHVIVNGKDLGLYSHIESIKTELLSRYFENASGNLYEGALSDFQPDWVGTYQKKTNEENPDRSDLDAVVEACQAPDEQFVEAIEPLIDLDQYYTFWAMEVALSHVDGYAARNHNNTYIYNDPMTGLFHFIPWGIDAIMFDAGRAGTPRSVFAHAIIPHRLYQMPDTQAVYIERLNHVLDTVLIEDEILAEIDRMEELIAPFTEPNGFRQPGCPDLESCVEEVRNHVRLYPDLIRAELTPEPPVWDWELPRPPCFRFVGTASATFSTSWASLTGQGAGTGELEVFFHEEDQEPGNPLNTATGFAVAGLDEQSTALVGIIADVFDQPNPARLLMAVYIFDQTLIRPNAVVPLDMATAIGIVHYDDLALDENDVQFLLLNGELRFDQAGMIPGEPVSGTINAEIRESGW